MLVNSGTSIPKLRTGTNGRNSILYKKYAINKPQEDFTEMLNEIRN
ncbi:hypothetical protein KQI30_16225 [Clostridium bornimense]|nr:hypothetical protein [Clostridium bornimense]MBU5317797.1 hypothetical protein [Clostridium bornimense]